LPKSDAGFIGIWVLSALGHGPAAGLAPTKAHELAIEDLGADTGKLPTLREAGAGVTLTVNARPDDLVGKNAIVGPAPAEVAFKRVAAQTLRFPRRG